MTSMALPGGDGADQPYEPLVVAEGLNKPRQLSLTRDGVLLAAEASKGGDECAGEGEGALCVGDTGAVSAFFQPLSSVGASPVRVVTGLLSGSGPGGASAVGSDGVSAREFLGGSIYVIETEARLMLSRRACQVSSPASCLSPARRSARIRWPTLPIGKSRTIPTAMAWSPIRTPCSNSQITASSPEFPGSNFVPTSTCPRP